MDSSFILRACATAIGLFTLFRKFRLHHGRKETDSSSASPSSSSVPPSSSSHNWTHQVFPSFCGEDVRRDFLSHIQKEFQRKGITPFIDNEIKRGESIGPELTRAIRGSKIAIVLLSRNYASSKWCLNELVEIMKCREELGQTVMVVFYKVDPTDVKKHTGDFGRVLRRTCMGKTKEEIGRWRQALEKVATIAGYHSKNWDNEAAMIEKITTDISNKLNNSRPSNDFDDLVGMRAHMEKMEPLLCLGLDDVRMIGIWGPSGIGKTTIARFLFNQHSDSFDLSVFIENFKAFMYTRPVCSDDYGLKLQLHQQFMSQIINQKDIEIPHLGVAQDRLKDKKVLVVLDDVDRSVQLDAMAKETQWFGPGSRIIITTQDRRLLKAHGIEDIYKVDFPAPGEALQIFCMNAFGKSSPGDGFEELASEVTSLACGLPLGLRVMGSYFKNMCKQDWIEALPRLRTHLDSDIQSILKFSYDALDDRDKDLFLHIACFFRSESIENLERYLQQNFSNVRQELCVLAEKSLISFRDGRVEMHYLLTQLGREIIRKQSVHDPGQRQFLVDVKEIREVLTDATGSRSVLGIYYVYFGENGIGLNISEKAFSGLSNLQFLRVVSGGCGNKVHLPRGLNYLSPKLIFLHWEEFPFTSLPSEFNTEFLVKLYLTWSSLENLWEGIQPLRNLMWMDLHDSKNLKELPDLSTATNLQELDLSYCSNLVELPSSIGKLTNLPELVLGGCSRLVELPSSIGNLTNLQELVLCGCLSLVKLPFSIGNATNLTTMDLTECLSLVELPASIGNLHKLSKLSLKGCSKLQVLPININLESLDELDLTDCSLLKLFPEISTNIECLKLVGTSIDEVPSSIRSWPRLVDLHMSYNDNLKEFWQVFDGITVLNLSYTEIQEIGPWVKNLSCLYLLVLTGCKKLVSLPQLPDSLLFLSAGNCESLERLDCFFHNPEIYLNFSNCSKLNQEARDLIFKTPTSKHSVLPGGKIPAYFSDRATGACVTVKLNERPLHTFLRFKACILLVDKGEDFDPDSRSGVSTIEIKQNGPVVTCRTSEFALGPLLTDHLYAFEIEAEMTSHELVFEFKFDGDRWEIRECGVHQIPRVRVNLHEHDKDCEKKCNRKQETLRAFFVMYGITRIV